MKINANSSFFYHLQITKLTFIESSHLLPFTTNTFNKKKKKKGKKSGRPEIAELDGKPEIGNRHY